MANNSEWHILLKKVHLFSTCTGDHFSMLAKKMTLVSLPKSAVLFHENDPGDSLYIIVSGSIRVLRQHTPPAKMDDAAHTQAYLSRGDCLGETALLSGERRTNTAVADSTSELLVLYKRDFDKILEKNPTLAVHLSRNLSSQLASLVRDGGGADAPAKLFSVIAALPLRDQIVFSVNLGLALAEQTRRKVLLCVVDEGDHAAARSLGLDPIMVSDANIRKGLLQDGKKFVDQIMLHPSGLEVLALEKKVFEDSIHGELFSFFEILRDKYDFCLLFFPSQIAESLRVFLQESTRIFVVAGPQTAPEELDTTKKIELMMPPTKKLEHIWLSAGREFSAGDFFPDIQFPWDLEWGRAFSATGSPYLPATAVRGQRMMDRLARSLGGIVVGFAMGSGAAFGYALIGMLKVLEREGIFPDVISGTSMGALIGSFYAAGIGPDQLEDIAASINRKKLWTMADPTIPRSGIIRGKGVLDFLRSHLGDKTFSELVLPFACVATDIQTGKEIILNDGNVAEAVRASLSLPFFFQPYYLNGRYLVDGGLVNPVPTSITLAQGANIVLSANLTSKASERRVPRVIGWRRRLPTMMRGPTIPEIMMKTIYIMQYEIAAARSELAHVVMEIKAHDFLWWDLDHSRDMVKLGEASAEESVPKIKALLPFHADSCKVRLTRKGRRNY